MNESCCPADGPVLFWGLSLPILSGPGAAGGQWSACTVWAQAQSRCLRGQFPFMGSSCLCVSLKLIHCEKACKSDGSSTKPSPTTSSTEFPCLPTAGVECVPALSVRHSPYLGLRFLVFKGKKIPPQTFCEIEMTSFIEHLHHLFRMQFKNMQDQVQKTKR